MWSERSDKAVQLRHIVLCPLITLQTGSLNELCQYRNHRQHFSKACRHEVVICSKPARCGHHPSQTGRRYLPFARQAGSMACGHPVSNDSTGRLAAGGGRRRIPLPVPPRNDPPVLPRHPQHRLPHSLLQRILSVRIVGEGGNYFLVFCVNKARGISSGARNAANCRVTRAAEESCASLTSQVVATVF